MAINNNYCEQPELVQGTLNLDPDEKILQEPPTVSKPLTGSEDAQYMYVGDKKVKIHPRDAAVEEMGMRPLKATQD